MKMLGAVVVLVCGDIESMLAFYQRALQFIVVKQQQSDDGLRWVQLQSGDVVLMLQQQNKPPVASSSPCLFFYVDDVRELHHYLGANQLAPGDLRETAYGMLEFDLRDPQGHCLTIGQRMSDG